MQVESFLENSARTMPDKTALVCGERRLSYAEVEEQANRLARSLLGQGIRRGDRVAVYLDSPVETVVSLFAILKAGAVFLVINASTKADKVAYILNNSRARGLVVEAGKLRGLQPVWSETPHLEAVWTVSGGDQGAPCEGKRFFSFDAATADPELSRQPLEKQSIDIDLAALIYTSGTTGQPKGVMLTHLNITSAATSIAEYLEVGPEDVILNVLPLSFTYGLSQVFLASKQGATLVLQRSFAYAHSLLETLIREKVTGFPLVPVVSAVLLQLDLAKYQLPDLRFITNAAAALPTQHIFRLRTLLPHVQIFSMYGLTECQRVSYLPPDEIDSRPDSIGKGMPNQEVYVADEEGRRVDAGVTGELVVRGSHVMKGYWENPEETARVLRPGPLPGERVLHTGDLFRMDEAGYLYFVSRKDDIIKTRGEKVSPREVENALYALDAVAEAAVIGIPDPVLGQAIKAVIALRPGVQITEREVLRHCAQHLEDFMVPKSVEFWEAIPKTSNGKISRKEIGVLVGKTQ